MLKYNILKKLIPNTFLSRMFLFIGLIIFVVQIIYFVMFYDYHFRQNRAKTINNNVKNISYIVLTIVKAKNNQKLEAQIIKEVKEHFYINTNISNVLPFIDNKKNVSKYDVILFYKELKKRIPYNIYVKYIKQNLLISIQVKNDKFLNFLLDENIVFVPSFLITIMWVSVTYIILLCLIFLLFRNQIKPLRMLAKYSRMFGKGEDLGYLKPAGSLELRQAIFAFNEMKEKIKNHIDQRTLMLSSISHDLKTSLTRMQLILELTDEIKNESFYKELIKEINNMNDMITSYLEFAKTGIKIVKIKENIDVVILIKKCISRIKKKKKIEIVKNADEVSIEVNESSLTRILNNIIDNAVSYSNKIIITIVKEEKKYLTILVDDDGIGIPKEKYSEVFKPFFRLNNARTMENKNLNVGLGLAIVKDLVIQIGGKIELDKSPLQGLRVKIDLPV
jgi:two-component system osmolarity sensor histidine kinase EnvZ